jgi:hypothetical protein
MISYKGQTYFTTLMTSIVMDVPSNAIGAYFKRRREDGTFIEGTHYIQVTKEVLSEIKTIKFVGVIHVGVFLYSELAMMVYAKMIRTPNAHRLLERTCLALRDSARRKTVSDIVLDMYKQSETKLLKEVING